MAGNIGEVTVKLDIRILEESEKARDILRTLIRDELAHLDPATVANLTEQITKQFERKD